MITAPRILLAGALAQASCRATPGPTAPASDPAPHSQADRRFAALRPTRLAPSGTSRALDAAIASHFERHATRRGYVMTDKPLYQPGETIWFRADVRATGTLLGAPATGATVQLVSPRGAIAAQKRLALTAGVAHNDFVLPADLEGGEYALQLAADDGTSDRRTVVIASYEPPRLDKTLEFVRKAYGPGDPVSAAIAIKRATGEPYAGRPITGVVSVDGAELARLALRTDGDGKAVAKFALPLAIARGDGLLTILADDGGVTESIQKRIPIVVAKLAVAMFPEGGDLVDGLAGRVYFRATSPLGKPADIAGRIVDDRGRTVGELASIHDGMGSFELEPEADRSYHVEITRPAGIAQTFALPAARSGGCVLRSVPSAAPDAIRVAATCTAARSLVVEAVLRETRLAGGALDVAAGAPALIELPVDRAAQGAVRVTLLSSRKEPLAERLVYHGRGHDLRVSLTPDRSAYAPRDPVKLRVRVTDPAGAPVRASLGLAVVDDSVLTLADDKAGRILARLYLEPELAAAADLAADPIEDPNFYFSDRPEAPAALDALLATRGYRRFEWQAVLAPPPPVAPVPPVAVAAMAPAPAAMRPPMELEAAPEPARPMPARKAGRARAALAEVDLRAAPANRGPVGRAEQAPRAIARKRAPGFARGDADLALDDDRGVDAAGWAVVRVFPVPAYTRPYDGPRTDFRETIYWSGDVQTTADGTAEVAFVTSDAITAFCATAEGVSAGGVAGSGSAVFASRMPLTLDARLPLEVTAGDQIRLPVTLANATDRALDAMLVARFGSALHLAADPIAGPIHLGPGEKTTRWFPLDVVSSDGAADVDLALTTQGLQDRLHKQIRIVPLGFPFTLSAAGTARSGSAARHEFDLAAALPGSIRASATLYPSPLAAMTRGMEGLIREPGGCFEQTSATNYPNIMVLAYLGAHDAADPALVARAQGMLDRGYKLLTGFETRQRGYEWFGQSPGHEALTAYGLMEFADMARVYDVDRAMIERTASWLMDRRDHKGGFQRSAEALDSFGRAGAITTNAYILWALAEAHRTAGLDAELAAQRALAAATADPYLLALAANTALVVAPGAGDTRAAVARLGAMQRDDGSFPGAKESITMSGGASLAIETTALAALALIKASPAAEHEPQIRRAVDWLSARRGGWGEWGNTQATVLALKALTAYADHTRQMPASGAATLVVNGVSAGVRTFDQGRRDALGWDVPTWLTPGRNTLALELTGGASLPYSIAIEYRAAAPQSSPRAKIAVTTGVDRARVRLGEPVVLHANIENVAGGGVPMTLARIGIPGGLTFQTWQLKELRDKGAIDFYETGPREVVLYWRALAPGAKKAIDLHLLAQVPGRYTAPATSAYLYYTAEDKAWASPVAVTIEP